MMKVQYVPLGETKEKGNFFSAKLEGFVRFKINDPDLFKKKAHHWSKSFEICCCLNSNGYQEKYHSFDWVLAAGAKHLLKPESNSFESLRQFRAIHSDWLFGYLGYDLKNEIEDLISLNYDGVGFGQMLFFRPHYLLFFIDNYLYIEGNRDTAKDLLNEIITTDIQYADFVPKPKLRVQSRLSKSSYLNIIEAIRQHIREGDVYELNFCQEFFIENFKTDPYQLSRNFEKSGPAPFGAFFREKDRYLMSGSPERFLKKINNRLISQPIKGTIKRSEDPILDTVYRNRLAESEKDRAENVMIVDLVRNDLARTCIPGTVKVEELFGIYGFKQVYQMISTVIGDLRAEIDAVDAIQAAFPMGSMTGAPKIMAMQLIENYEQTKRGLYSGSIGYFTPDGDFDFNVVIRSMLYNARTNYLSFQTGGAIVYDSDPESEYLECLLKAKGMAEALGVSQYFMAG